MTPNQISIIITSTVTDRGNKLCSGKSSTVGTALLHADS
nr:MAG TPA: hypothetical protein [Caudoviricetes sp.]